MPDFVITQLKYKLRYQAKLYKAKAKLKGAHLRESKGGLYRDNSGGAPPRHFDNSLSVYLFLKF